MLGEPICPGVHTTPVPLDLGVSPKVEHFATVMMLVTTDLMTRTICVTDNEEVGQHPWKLLGWVCVCARGGGLEENLFSKFNDWTFLSLQSLPLVNRMTAQQKRRKSQGGVILPGTKQTLVVVIITLGVVIMMMTMLIMLQLFIRFGMIIKKRSSY